MEFKNIEELIEYMDNEFIPSHIKRKLNSTPYSSSTLDMYYIEYSDIYELYLDDELLEYVINYIKILGIDIDNSLDENITLNNRKYYYTDKRVEEVNKMFISLRNAKENSEYYRIRNDIFYLYLDYVEYVLDRVIHLYDVPKEDLKNDIFLALLEAIEQFDDVKLFSTYLNNYVKRYLSKKYSTLGAYILDIESTEYSKECLNNNYYLNKSNSYKAFTKENHRIPQDIHDLDLIDEENTLEEFFDKINYGLLCDYIVNLKRDKYYHDDVFERDKMYFMLYYGIGYDRRYTVIEIGQIVGRLQNVVSARIRHFTEKLIERLKRESYVNGKRYSLLRRNYMIQKR